jgi:hypothetical protein
MNDGTVFDRGVSADAEPMTSGEGYEAVAQGFQYRVEGTARYAF